MITLHFSECCAISTLDKLVIEQPPRVLHKGEHYERVLRTHAKWNIECVTYDEMCILVAQFLRRTESLEIRLMSWCQCHEAATRVRIIPLDQDGDLIDEPFHGFFNQRLKYLR